MSEDTRPEDREHEPTGKKLRDAREKGDVAMPADLAAAAATAGLGAALLWTGSWMAAGFGALGTGLIDRPEDAALLIFGDADARGPGFLPTVSLPALPLFLLPAAAALAVFLVTRSLAVSQERITPRLSRIDPVATARNKFGPEGLGEFVKSAAKLLLTGALLAGFAAVRLPEILSTGMLAADAAAAVMVRLAGEFLLLAAGLGAAVGGADYLWQHRMRARRNRMSRQELMDEFRQSEGDPMQRAERRRRAQDLAAGISAADIRAASVVVVNPTHVAVALRWTRGDRTAPVCVAKGVDALALRIREIAAEAGVPIRSDPPTARAIFATVGVGEPVRPEHYRAVAAAIRFAEAMRLKARAGGVA